MMHTGTRRPAPCAFTLVELLVVVAIISVLAAMLLPSLQAALKQAQLISCSNKERQIGTALFMFVDDNGDHLPFVQGWNNFSSNMMYGVGYGSQTPSTYNNWWGFGQLYKGNYLLDRTIFSCPVRTDHGRWLTTNGGAGGADYAAGWTCYAHTVATRIRLGTSTSNYRIIMETYNTSVSGWPPVTWRPTLEQYRTQWSHDPAGQMWGARVLLADVRTWVSGDTTGHSPNGLPHSISTPTVSGANVLRSDGSAALLDLVFDTSVGGYAYNAYPQHAGYGSTGLYTWWQRAEKLLR